MAATRSGSNRAHIIFLAVASGWLTALACGGDGRDDRPLGSGGTTVSSGGTDSGGASTGGAGAGGLATGGTGTGGTGTGGTGTGGLATGGTGTGGTATGGVGTGGTGTGGTATGGTSAGGTATGGVSTGGTSSGGGGTGGSTCVPVHFAGSSCSSCHGLACTCETQYTSCYGAVCASPDTPIATPSGARPIASLAVGDLVYSVDRGEVVAVPVRKVRRARAGLGHKVVRVALATGSVLEISAPHPTADGRSFGALRTGGRLGGVQMADVELVPYRHEFTYDILPESDSGTYFAGGVLIGSTLAEFPDRALRESIAAPTPGAVPCASCEERCKSRWALGGW